MKINRLIPLLIMITSIVGCHETDFNQNSICDLNIDKTRDIVSTSEATLEKILKVGSENSWIPEEYFNPYEIQDQIIERYYLSKKINNINKLDKNCSLIKRSIKNIEEEDSDNKFKFKAIIDIDRKKEAIMEENSCQTEEECELILKEQFTIYLNKIEESSDITDCSIVKNETLNTIKELNKEIEYFLLNNKDEKWLNNRPISERLMAELTVNQIEIKRIEKLKDERNDIECENIVHDNEDYLAELSKIKLYNKKIINFKNNTKETCESKQCQDLRYNNFILSLNDK